MFGELTRSDLLEQALQLVVGNGGAPGVDDQSIQSITAKPETRSQWLERMRGELQTKSYRPLPVRLFLHSQKQRRAMALGDTDSKRRSGADGSVADAGPHI